MGGFYQPRDGWYIYYIQGYHTQFLFRVPRRQAVADFPEVLRKIKVAARDNADPPNRVKWAVAVLEQDQAPSRLSPEEFLVLLHGERLKANRTKSEAAYRYALSEDQAFDERWARAGRFWLNIVCESAYFAGLILFVLWPWMRGERRAWLWSLHLGLLPLLLMLPYYSGYASWTFTSAGPGGGVLYPWVISWFRRFPVFTGADQWVLARIPKVLEPLSQPLGPWLVISGGGSLGPVMAVVLGAGIGLLVVLGLKWIKVCRQQILSRKAAQ